MRPSSRLRAHISSPLPQAMYLFCRQNFTASIQRPSSRPKPRSCISGLHNFSNSRPTGNPSSKNRCILQSVSELDYVLNRFRVWNSSLCNLVNLGLKYTADGKYHSLFAVVIMCWNTHTVRKSERSHKAEALSAKESRLPYGGDYIWTVLDSLGTWEIVEVSTSGF